MIKTTVTRTVLFESLSITGLYIYKEETDHIENGKSFSNIRYIIQKGALRLEFEPHEVEMILQILKQNQIK